MKKILTLLLLLTAQALCYGQDMSVESFVLDPDDLDAKTYETEYDINGRKAALIKIQTTEKGFTFGTGGLGIVKTNQDKGGEVWVYVPPGVFYLTLSQQQQGYIKYEFPIPIKSAFVYRMKLTTKKGYQVFEESAGGQYLLLNSTPPDIEFIVDNGDPTTITDGEGNVFLTYGEHSYTANSRLYKPQSGTIVINDEQQVLNIDLTPNFGYLYVTSAPSGANVELNGNIVGQTPYSSDRLELGEHQVKVSAPNYETHSQVITLVEGMKREPIATKLKANFGYLAINSVPSGATVEINDMIVGQTPYKSGMLPLGERRVKVSAPTYDPYTQTVNLTEGGETINIEPILTSYLSNISIECDMSTAAIVINGKEFGRGKWSGNLSPGTYELKAEKSGHRPAVQRLVVERNTPQDISLSAPTPMYGSIKMSSDQNGISASLNGKVLGSLPNVFKNVLVGTHTITLAKEGFVPQNVQVTISEGKLSEYHQKPMMSVKDSEEYKAEQQAKRVEEARAIALREAHLRRTAWQREPISYILPQLGYDISNGTASYGIMAGWSKKFGGYIKYLSNFKSSNSDGLECNNDGVISGEGSELVEPNYKESIVSLYSATAGAIYRVKPWLSVYAGGGLGSRVFEFELLSGEYVKNIDISTDSSFALDAGALMRFGGFSLSVGLNTIAMKYSQLNLGIGVNF